MTELGQIHGETLQFERRFDAPPERIWRAITDPGELRGWLAHVEVDLRVGGAIVLTFENDDEPSTMRGEITELEEGRVLEYSWAEGDVDSMVRFELAPDDAGTKLTLRHEFREARDLSGFGGGWHHHLELLEAQVAGGSRDWDWDRYRALKAQYEKLAVG